MFAMHLLTRHQSGIPALRRSLYRHTEGIAPGIYQTPLVLVAAPLLDGMLREVRRCSIGFDLNPTDQ